MLALVELEKFSVKFLAIFNIKKDQTEGNSQVGDEEFNSSRGPHTSHQPFTNLGRKENRNNLI